MAITVKRESLDTRAIHVSPSYTDQDGAQQLAGSEKPLPTRVLSTLRLDEGRAYAAGIVRSIGNPLTAGASIDLAIAFASGVTPTILISGLCGGDAEGYLYEGATVTGGTAITAMNMNRNSLSTSQSAILAQPTVSATGNLLVQQLLLGGGGKKASGGDIDSLTIILKPLTTYLFRLTNINGTDHVAEIILSWYE